MRLTRKMIPPSVPAIPPPMMEEEGFEGGGRSEDESMGIEGSFMEGERGELDFGAVRGGGSSETSK